MSFWSDISFSQRARITLLIFGRPEQNIARHELFYTELEKSNVFVFQKNHSKFPSCFVNFLGRFAKKYVDQAI